jgi:hypothetical protein
MLLILLGKIVVNGFLAGDIFVERRMFSGVRGVNPHD